MISQHGRRIYARRQFYFAIVLLFGLLIVILYISLSSILKQDEHIKTNTFKV